MRINPVILSKERVDLDNDEIEEEKPKLPKRKLNKLSRMTVAKLQQKPFTKAVNHLQEIIENDPVDMNAVETAFEQLRKKSAKLKEVEDAVLELMIESNCTQEAYNIEFEAIEGYAEKMIAWQVRVKNIMKTDALGQKDNHSLVTSSSSTLRLPKIQFQQFSG
ncbi:hypothetical protein TNIN_218861, partial [Trichonephila inaurata madagascariensis]